MSGPLHNPRHEQFAQFVAGGKSPTESYICCGFSSTGAAASGNRLLKVAKVRTRVDELSAQMEKSQVAKAIVNKDWIVSTLRLNVERSMQEVAVTDSKGEPTGEYRYDGSVANRALELLGKELGMFKERLEMSGAVVVDPGREAVPDVLLDAMIAQAQLQSGQPKQIEETVQ